MYKKEVAVRVCQGDLVGALRSVSISARFLKQEFQLNAWGTILLTCTQT